MALYTVETGTPSVPGGEMEFEVPTGERWILISMMLRFTSAPGGPAREVALVLDDGSQQFWRGIPPVTHPANRVRDYGWAAGGADYMSARGNGSNVELLRALLPRLFLQGGYRVRTLTNNLQSGDSFAAPVLLVVRYSLEEVIPI